MNPFGRRLAILSLISIFLFSTTAIATTVLAIDYGSDYIKASLIKPGMPFDVLLDKDSKRKIRSSVAWKNGERLFGQNAFNIVRATLCFCLLFFEGRALTLPELMGFYICRRRAFRRTRTTGSSIS